MKKFLVIALAMALLLGMSSLAFASRINERNLSNFKGGAEVKGNIIKHIFFHNNVDATTGVANATGNVSLTCAGGSAEADSCGENGCATNTSAKDVINHGTADAYTNPANALNQANNSVENTITEDAEATADCNVCVSGEFECDGATGLSHSFTDGNNDGKCDICGGCCPAVIDGDICEFIGIDNDVDATTGDANATGNASATIIDQNDKAKACNDGCATNTSTINVSNTGDANAESGPAVATNLADNYVAVDIFRGAMSSKTIDICVDLMAD
ncbi:MAG: hypothetical protein COW32_03080 [Candidatus Aquicultor secundus]|uniref:Uncharacterized protein n=1 Tax=Candidatus Aquicultor secundus TaxID=1973895 RepID=A0A2M7TAB7_9ACTN|nr:hypothetical protein [Candidatus Aquicultor secundus]NCO65200.1 hypothetical protein [Solirubrobacter sp.]OIO87610.1 MAG: hypothetical protein AUK32_03455 [Candidatus Aquicultor secundus]PIU28070.1 MAG: hypothetical protein COT10_00175 [Candidatus Aquicultor secundus]PIW22753.1 MAG: hypothetical protein COW32_03080 [Candidatus Aquicultor secundus]PIX53096.1 MAG: hypothetical protein COZ51_00670 [Candidatus Aquicultor secundus]